MDRFPPLDPQARRVLAFSFLKDLSPGDSIVSATVNPTLASGADSSPGGVLVGSPVTQGTLVMQMATGREAGNAYVLKCLATTAGGEVLTLSAAITMVEGA